MAQLTPWLSPASFEGRIRLPGNFDFSVFDAALTDIVEDSLPSLLGADRLAALLLWLTDNPYGLPAGAVVTENPVMASLYAQIVPYLVYSVYAEYIMTSDVQPTDTGLVVKDRSDSEALSDTARMQLYRTYRDKANSRAQKLATYVAGLQPATDCKTTGIITELRISSSRGKTVSITSSL